MTAESIAGLPWVRETPTSAGTRSWLTRIARWLKSATLSPAETELLETVRAAATVVGAPILEAASASELDDRIESGAENPILIRFSTRAIELTTIDMLVDATSDGEPVPAGLVDALGDGPAMLVARAHRIEVAAASAVLQWRLQFGDALLVEGARELEQRLPDFFYDPEVPSTVQLGVLSGLRSSVAALGMAHAMFGSRRLEPWMAQRLAETYRHDLYEYLRFLAALPFVFVPEDVLPSGDRLDLDALERAHAAAEREIHELAAQADASGGDLSLVAVPDDP